LVDRTIASFDENQIHSKLCKNCKFFIDDNKNNEFSRCSKFMKPRNGNRVSIGKKYKQPLLQYKPINSDFVNNFDKNDTLLLFYLTKTCRVNETMCGIDAKYYERKFFDVY